MLKPPVQEPTDPMFAFRQLLSRSAMSLGLAVAMIAAPTVTALAEVRLKDIVEFEGVRDNMLVGYGLVVGLNGTGDALDSAPFTQQSLVGMLERLGVNTRSELSDLDTANVAAVIVTATLPAFARQGSRIDVSISALGDAESLQGGTLLVTPMLGADGEVYSVAQGPLIVSGFSAAGAAESITSGVPTAAKIPNGAIVEREIDFDLNSLAEIRLSLRNPDFTTSRRIAQAINTFTKSTAAESTDPSTVKLSVPEQYKGSVVALLTDIEQLTVTPDQLARVVVDEHSGVIVMGENVRISTVAIAQGNLTIRITETPQVSQPNAFSETGNTEVVDRTNIEVDEDAENRLAVLQEEVTLRELVNGLNALGVGPRDMISILQTIKAAGALQADIEVM